MLQYASDLKEPFSRNELPAHFTASAAVVDEAGRRICLVDHVKLCRRLQPGGHIEPDDETAAAAAIQRHEGGQDIGAGPHRVSIQDQRLRRRGHAATLAR